MEIVIGASFTRFQTLRLSKLFPNVLDQVLISYGSCQFPTLGFVVERYKSIQDFISENFWKIEGILSSYIVVSRLNVFFSLKLLTKRTESLYGSIGMKVSFLTKRLQLVSFKRVKTSTLPRW
jgi:DNA topoisomerase IA